MPENKQPRVKTNEVTISGYLKENNLVVQYSPKGGSAIKGKIIIAVDELNSILVNFYISDKQWSGEPSKDYEKILNLLPEHTRSIAGYLSENSGATFAEAIKAADKVWVRGSFDEFTRLDEDGKEAVSISVKAFSARIVKESTETFKPYTDFKVRTYIDEMTDELDASNKPTGRILITGLIPKKSGVMVKIPFVAPATDGIAELIKAKYAVGNTVDIEGNLVNVKETIEEEATVDTGYFGSYSKKQHFTKIINERVITGGCAPLTEGMEGAISKTEVKIGLAKRKEKIEDNTSRSNSRSSGTSQNASFSTFKSKSEDIDVF